MKYTRLYADSDGISHFEDVKVTQTPLAGYVSSGAGKAPTMHISSIREAISVAFARFPPGWVADFHPAPRRQLMTCLSGEWETIDGTKQARRFKPGDVLLLEDTSGSGHFTRVLGDNDCVVQITVVPELREP